MTSSCPAAHTAAHAVTNSPGSECHAEPANTGPGVLLNDIHSNLNATRVASIARPATIAELCALVRAAAERGGSLSIGGARHAMGGQQFRAGAAHVDITGLDRILSMDHTRGLLTAQAGITWPALIQGMHELQARESHSGRPFWSIRQKQTGADSLTLGGALSANIHGRGLRMRPIIDDVERFTLVNPRGELVECSRERNPELFRLAIGGYGLFGVIATVTLRLMPRVALRRRVQVTSIADAATDARAAMNSASMFADFQFEIDPMSPHFLTRGVFARYEIVGGEADALANVELAPDDWRRLLLLAHTDKSRAFQEYARHYLATDGQTYWSDTHQLGVYLDNYHAEIDRATGAACRCSEMISELYVPPDRIADFLQAAQVTLRALQGDVIYGTVRLIHKDEESFLAWARETFACVIFNLHVEHSPAGLEHAAACFRVLIDLALDRGGSFYLTYHRFATREQLLRAYPQLPAFIAAKRRLDPAGVFDSEWWRWIAATAGTPARAETTQGRAASPKAMSA